MCLPCRQAEPDREPLRINDRVDFGRKPASGATETMICVCAPPSCRRSLLVGTNRSAVDHLDVAVVCGGDGVHHPILTPAFRHRTKRLWQVVRGPNRSGRSRQGAPDRSTQKMPFSTRRSSTRGTPRGLLGRSGAITRHSKSVRSYRLMHMLNQISHATPIPFMGLRPSFKRNRPHPGAHLERAFSEETEGRLGLAIEY